MPMTMHLDVVSAEESIFSGVVEELVAPGTMGDLGILPRHSQLITTLKAGELRYKLSSSDIIAAGKLTVSFLKEAAIEKDAYIGLYGTSTSTSNHIVDHID